MKSLNELVADEILVRYSLYPQDNIEVNAGLGETEVPDKRLKTVDAALRLLEIMFVYSKKCLIVIWK